MRNAKRRSTLAPKAESLAPPSLQRNASSHSAEYIKERLRRGSFGEEVDLTARLRDLLSKNSAQVIDLMHSIDENKDGVIQLEEWSAALRQLGFSASPKQAAATFNALDVDGSGTIDFAELEGALKAMQPIQAKLKQTDIGALLGTILVQNRGRVLDLMRDIDANGDGKITRDEASAP